MRTLKAYRESYFSGKEKQELWGDCKKYILRIKGLAERKRAKLLFVIFPVLYDLDDDYCLRDIDDAVSDFLKENEIPVHSLLKDFIAYEGTEESLRVSILDAHPNEKAHEIAAHSLFRYLTNSGLLEK